jgi:hypothetical protein
VATVLEMLEELLLLVLFLLPLGAAGVNTQAVVTRVVLPVQELRLLHCAVVLLLLAERVAAGQMQLLPPHGQVVAGLRAHLLVTVAQAVRYQAAL